MTYSAITSVATADTRSATTLKETLSHLQTISLRYFALFGWTRPLHISNEILLPRPRSATIYYPFFCIPCFVPVFWLMYTSSASWYASDTFLDVLFFITNLRRMPFYHIPHSAPGDWYLCWINSTHGLVAITLVIDGLRRKYSLIL